MTTTEHDTLNRLPDVERWLDDHGIAWALEDVDLADVDLPAGYKNQTRLDAINREAVDRYTADMENGAVFPPVILRHAGAKWIPVDGNHRLTATRAAGRTSITAYLPKQLTAEEAHELAIAANRTHGLPLTDEERLWHAVQMTENRATIREAAAACGIPASRLQNHLSAQKFARRCTSAGIDGWSTLNVSLRARLAEIIDDRCFRRTVELAASGQLIHKETDELITRVKQHLANSELIAALDLIDETRANVKGRTRNGRGHPPSATLSPRRRLVTDLDLLMSRFQPKAVAADCETDIARQQTSDQIKAVARHLMKIERELWR